ncbi:MAG: JAB domain-containing protein [Muricauda sp.]|uniref:Putative DNA repair protein n=1 Tax=Flagellimonas lutaonensis TaxID=516051 RepID=A0A0D5YQ67_9FLAO|nr:MULTISPECIES: DNA repair protein RadC [Allomuricauda]AKA34450.1 Putative DNA repair protein [Allomuricauda lutaonensis]MAU26360.1 JAB domain-containing protein [Allomuricauda sp.]MBC30985.1 JAB domain-containing protein [Allomuricauda sp.]|tara:strand:+ start:34571 stop:35269 length:699 start_codon:yes stop_codon:yes gene_type:complete
MQEEKASLSIKDWADDDKPREKLVQKGRSVLSDAELIAILIGSGSKNESAVELSKRILASVGNNLNDLGRLSVKQLMQFKGIGEAKAVTIAAALEIGRRRRREAGQQITKIASSGDAFELLQPLIGELEHEEFWILYLNNSNKVVHKGQLSKGGITGTLVDVRLVMKQALELGAVALILAHNHPSGTLVPSKADKTITQKLKSAAQALDIKVLDHLIIAQKAYLSFADEQLL